MTRNDAKIAREWAEAWDHEPDGIVIAAVRRHILATTQPLTMADIAWDDEVHAGLCAEDSHHGLVRMLTADLEGGIWCMTEYGERTWTRPKNLTPIPGTRVDLTPRREPEPGSDPDRPFELTTEADYRNAPKGTVVAMSAEAWTKTAENEWSDPTGRVDDKYMSSSARRVLRWGWKA